MADFKDSTLWRISEFERVRSSGGAVSSLAAAGPTLLPTTLIADLRQLQREATPNDVLEVMAACLRHKESALLYLECGPFVWPVTLFPLQQLYHSPRDVPEVAARIGLSRLKLISLERPGLRPPGHSMHDRVAAQEKYHPLPALLWAVALDGPRNTLLNEISGRAAYRLAPGRASDMAVPPGALAPAVARLRNESTSLREIAAWPGMSVGRASRLLNALYLTDALMVTRSHPAARNEPTGWRGLLGRRR